MQRAGERGRGSQRPATPLEFQPSSAPSIVPLFCGRLLCSRCQGCWHSPPRKACVEACACVEHRGGIVQS
eukprot:8878728-Lingulodinium_polyedra.AAC.1